MLLVKLEYHGVLLTAFVLILVIVFGNEIEERTEQPLNTFSAISSTPSAMVTVNKLVDLLNASPEIVFTLPGIEIEVKDVQSLNACQPIFFKPFESVTEDNDEHPSNA